MRTKSRSVAVILFDEAELLDFAVPMQVLSAAGRRWNFRPYKLHVLSMSGGLIETRNQLCVATTGALADAPAADVVFVPGGYGARHFASDEGATAALGRVARDAEIVAAVGNGVLPLLRAGLLREERLAVSADIGPELAALDSARLEQTARFVESGRVLTARTSGAALELSLAIIRRTLGEKLVNMVASELDLTSFVHTPRLEIRYSSP